MHYDSPEEATKSSLLCVLERHRDAILAEQGVSSLDDPIRCGNYHELRTSGLREKVAASSWEGSVEFPGCKVANCKLPGLNARAGAVCLLCMCSSHPPHMCSDDCLCDTLAVSNLNVLSLYLKGWVFKVHMDSRCTELCYSRP